MPTYYKPSFNITGLSSLVANQCYAHQCSSFGCFPQPLHLTHPPCATLNGEE